MLEALRAVRESDLVPSARHLIQTLISLGDPETCLIPDRFTPSLSDLKRFTGMSRSTVAVQLNHLEKEGWLKRDKPDTHRSWRDKERTRYFVQIPTSPLTGLASPAIGPPSPTTGPELVRPPDCTSPTTGHELPGLSNQANQEEPLTSPTGGDATQPIPRSKRTRKPEPRRDDVEQICTHLADRIESNGSKRPNITDDWRREIRLLLAEKRPITITVERAIALIDWAHQDPFWKRNIKSAKKFRDQYDTVRLQALEEWEKKAGNTKRETGQSTSPRSDGSTVRFRSSRRENPLAGLQVVKSSDIIREMEANQP